MSNSTASSESLLIDTIKYDLLASIGVISLVMGTIGNIFNILLFTRGSIWRQSPCIPYLLGSSISSLFLLYTNTLTRMLLGFYITPLFYDQILCKTAVYISTISNVIATWFMIGASFDRYISSSTVVTTRLITNMRTTRRVMAVIVFFVSIIYIEVLVCYESGNTVTIAPCANKNTMCATVDACLGFIFQLISPLLLFIFFGLGTFFNIRRSAKLRHIHVSAVVPSALKTQRKAAIANERAILRVVFVQVITFCICTLPNIATKIYQLIPVTYVKSDVRLSIENLVINMCTLLYTLDNAFSFYMYTLASGHFRKELKRLIYSYLRRHRIMPYN